MQLPFLERSESRNDKPLQIIAQHLADTVAKLHIARAYQVVNGAALQSLTRPSARRRTAIELLRAEMVMPTGTSIADIGEYDLARLGWLKLADDGALEVNDEAADQANPEQSLPFSAVLTDGKLQYLYTILK